MGLAHLLLTPLLAPPPEPPVFWIARLRCSARVVKKRVRRTNGSGGRTRNLWTVNHKTSRIVVTENRYGPLVREEERTPPPGRLRAQEVQIHPAQEMVRILQPLRGHKGRA